jgi:hypothetical protein
MSMTEGQELALEQLRAVEAASGGLLSVEPLKTPADPGDALVVKVTISCADLERAEGGLPLEDSEEVVVRVPPDFPYRYPAAWTLHHRFAGFPHVNWKSSLCLYQAPATEWDPSDGMFGFLERLHHFLRQGALGQLDPIGGALHPPVAYLGDGPVRIVIPRVDTPRVDGEPWFGTAHLRVHSELRVDIVGWSPYLDRGTPQNVAAVVLLPVPLPYEFPTKAGDLFAAFTERGVSQDQFFRTMQWAVLNNDADSPLFVVLGTPMRGIRGEQLRQHLAAWYIDPLHAWALKTELDRYSEDVEKQACGERLREILLEWAKIAPVEWCCVRENRPEIVTRRDQGSPMGWFAGRTVSIWGCGALGGHVAEHLARAGVRRLLLRDSGVVSPGVLLRQPYDDADVGTAKATALAACLRRICPDLEVETSTRNLIDDPLSAEDWSSGADLVIDAAASAAVMSLLEKRRWANGVVAAPIVSMAISHDASWRPAAKPRRPDMQTAFGRTSRARSFSPSPGAPTPPSSAHRRMSRPWPL